MRTTLRTVLAAVSLFACLPADARFPAPDACRWDIPDWVLERSRSVIRPYQLYLDQRARLVQPATAAGLRLRAVVSDYGSMNGEPQPGDSVVYTYSGNRGMERSRLIRIAEPYYHHPERQFDTMLRYNAVFGTGLRAPAVRTTRTYNDKSRLQREELHAMQGGSWALISARVCSYSDNGTESFITDSSFSGAVANVTSQRIVCDKHGSVRIWTRYNYSVDGELLAHERFSYSYDASRRLTQIDRQEPVPGAADSWQSSSRFLITYTGAGRFASLTELFLFGSWKELQRSSCYYHKNGYPAGQAAWYMGQGMGLETSDSTAIISHTISGLPLTSKMYAGTPDSCVDYAQNRYSYDVEGSEQCVIREYGPRSGMQGTRRDTNSYYAGGWIRAEQHDTWDSGGWKIYPNDYRRRYLYDALPDGALPGGGSGGLQAVLAPVPARDVLRLEAKVAAGGELQLAIVNVSGMLVRKWNASTAGTYAETIDVSALPAGIYRLRIGAAGNQWSRSFLVAH